MAFNPTLMPSLWSWGMLCDFFLYKYSNAANTPPPIPPPWPCFFSHSHNLMRNICTTKTKMKLIPLGFLQIPLLVTFCINPPPLSHSPPLLLPESHPTIYYVMVRTWHFIPSGCSRHSLYSIVLLKLAHCPGIA